MVINEEQEARGRDHFRPKKAAMASVVIGFFMLVFSKGIVWNSTGFPEAVMGRTDSTGPLAGGMFMVIGLQVVMALIYGMILGFAIYRWRPLAGILGGGALGLVLYGLNYMVFGRVLGWESTHGEGAVALTHLVFALFFSAAYKAIAVPRMQLVLPAIMAALFFAGCVSDQRADSAMNEPAGTERESRWLDPNRSRTNTPPNSFNDALSPPGSRGNASRTSPDQDRRTP